MMKRRVCDEQNSFLSITVFQSTFFSFILFTIIHKNNEMKLYFFNFQE